MDIVLRLETSADYAETEKVVREAFWNVYAPGCTEHYLVHVCERFSRSGRLPCFRHTKEGTVAPFD